MKIAIVLCGNLRTFLMPTREEPNLRLCDKFLKDIVQKNNADIFVLTDTNDFYYNNVQYFPDNRRIEILNNYTYRLHNKIDFIDHLSAQNLIIDQLEIFGDNLKFLHIEEPYDASQDELVKNLKIHDIKGNNPVMLVQQLRKIKLTYELLKRYEKEQEFKYDFILKWRFDNSVNGELDLMSYDYINNDIYVPGVHSPVIYDWFAFGKRNSMDVYLSLYDKIGTFIPDGRMYICSKCSYSGDNSHMCPNGELYEITLSMEYHLFKAFQQDKIKICNARYASCPYRYNNNTETIDEVMKKLNVDATLVTYKPGIEVNEMLYTRKYD